MGMLVVRNAVSQAAVPGMSGGSAGALTGFDTAS